MLVGAVATGAPPISARSCRYTPPPPPPLPIAGSVLISARMSATNGARSRNNPTSPPASPAVCRPATIGRCGQFRVRRRGRHQSVRRRRHLRAVEILQSLVRHAARARRRRASTTCCSTAPAASPMAACAASARPVGEHGSSRLDDRRGRRGRPHALERQDRVSLSRFRRPRLYRHRHRQRHGQQPGALGVNYRF